IDCGQTISQPLVVALMTQALNPKPEDTALEIGTGSGYQAAVLARMCRRVITVEREPALAERAASTLKRLGFENVEIAVADGSLVIPTRTGRDEPQDLRLYTRHGDEVSYRSLFPVLFVPLRTG